MQCALDVCLEEFPETEAQTRKRIMENVFKHRDNCIVLKIDTGMTDEKNISPFGFHFELDRKKYEKRRRQLRRQSENFDK